MITLKDYHMMFITSHVESGYEAYAIGWGVG
jgi:hypothetical protein